MALLSLTEISEKIKQKALPSEISDMIAHDEHTSMHGEAINYNRTYQGNKAISRFLYRVSQRIDPKKYQVFLHLMTYPIATVDITGSIFNEVNKVFNAQDRFIKSEFVDEELESDFMQYAKSIRLFDFWESDGVEILQNAVNSFIVIDRPMIDEMQSDESLPEPYFYQLHVKHVKSISQFHKNGVPEWIMFEDPSNQMMIHYYDRQKMVTHVIDDKGQSQLVSEQQHTLGYTPVKTFWNIPLTSKSRFQRKSPMTKSLSKWDRLLFEMVSRDHLHDYAAYPILVSYERKCDYEDEMGNVCESGKIRYWHNDEHGNQVMDHVQECPKCQEGQLMGAGTHLLAPPPLDNTDADIIDAVRFIGGDTDSIKFQDSTIEQKIEWLTYSTIGRKTDSKNDQAKNEKHIMSLIESRTSVFSKFAKGFEEIHKWTIDSIATMRYGTDYQRSIVNYGRKFFLNSVGELMSNYEVSKNSGFPAYELSLQREAIMETKYQNNPDIKERVKILSNLEPYPDQSLEELLSLHNIGVYDANLLALKANFDYYIRKFEREVMNISSFMMFSSFDTKINLIQQKLISYVDQRQRQQDSSSRDDSSTGERLTL